MMYQGAVFQTGRWSTVGLYVGTSVGDFDGLWLGCTVGPSDGRGEGKWVGAVGSNDGRGEGT